MLMGDRMPKRESWPEYHRGVSQPKDCDPARLTTVKRRLP